MNKFKVGDLVRGTKNSPYNITDEKMTLGEVIKVYGEDESREDDICVKVLEHRRSREVGYTFLVNSQYFDLVEPAPIDSAEKIILSPDNAHATKIVLSPDNAEDIDWLTYKASRIIERLSEKSGMPIERLTSLIVIGAEKLVEIEDGKEKEK